MTGNVRWLLRFARPATKRLRASVIARLVGQSLGAVQLALPAWAVGMLATGAASGAGFVMLVAVLFVLATAIKAGLRYVEQLFGHLAAFSLMGEMRVWMIDRLIPQAPAVTDGAGAARIQSTAVRDVDRVEVFFAHTIAPAISAVVIPLGAVLTAWLAAGWLPAVVLAGVMLVGVIVPVLGARSSRAAARTVAELRVNTTQYVADSVRLREEIMAAEGVPHRLATAREADENLAATLRRQGTRAGTRSALNTARLWGGTLLVLLASIPNLMFDGVSLPGALLAASLVAGTAAALDTVERLAGSLPVGLEATRRIRELAAGEPVVSEPEHPTEPDPLFAARASTPAIEVDKAGFTYPGRAEPVIDGVSIRVGRGEMIGIAGASGSGKSTLARLLQRHFDVAEGEIRVAGSALPVLGSAEVARRVVVADQEPFLLDATVAENLRLGAPDADAEELQLVLDLFMLDLDLDTPIGRRGDRLSGGQRQRLALARTLLRARRAPGALAGAVLVLDESTSHQDPITQARLVGTLRTLGATTVVIAHRLETLRDADRIHVMERGRIVESGAWHELVARDGAFRRLLQSDGEG
ncbi:amino acid ABC transporter ATP-binding/permease protein [Gulosibacter molinativorax]|uniref:ABC transporter ATP-binding protein n=1 Tax=Gulosibacter molinativorax TaxID=256821 RepID=A0ABT7C9T6_9MICO|nr:ABC transporter ATP-binding protein [Gulosibacter molinativorax]MDJ1371976.1 ABC transporter ATP-binding protein [Gulosibacter molinativorax]QUY62660.1 ABC transporter family protein [Gulosibacter molinativorax]